MSAIGTLAEGSVKEFTEKIADIMKYVYVTQRQVVL